MANEKHIIKAYKPAWAVAVGRMGLCRSEDGLMFVTDLEHKESLILRLLDKDGKMFDYVNMDLYKLSGNVCAVCIDGLKECDFSYNYSVDGVIVEDKYRRNSTSLRQYKVLKEDVTDHGTCYYSDFDWEDDEPCNIPYNEVIAYGLHVRGFTAHSSSKVKNKGTFAGVAEKASYLKELGINQVVLMPAYDFYEWDSEIDSLPAGHPKYASVDPKKDEIVRALNYWGFKEGAYYLPKTNYAKSNPVKEFKEMVKTLHKFGIEVVMRFYFPKKYNRNNIIDILKFWVADYHVDGFFLMGEDLPLDLIATNSALINSKIYYSYFDRDRIMGMNYSHNKLLAVCNDEYSKEIRKYLKSDENMLQSFIYHQRHNDSGIHNINYITDYYGFTLNDLVSYDYKHNEENGEDNRDGENFNYSWNCGYEGECRKKSVVNLRMKQIKNALTMLIMSQGVPMLLAGDEFLNSNGGNNNAYCQDNETGWVIWKSNKSSNEIFEYTKKLISLRKSHPILHKEEELRVMDYASCGYPDISYHSESAWYPRFDNHLRHIGICICGRYALVDRVHEDDFFFICVNMHWESHSFGLPKLPKNLRWSVIMDSSVSDGAEFSAVLSENEDEITVKDRRIVILKSYVDKNEETHKVTNKNIKK